MNILVIGANGKVGKQIVKFAAESQMNVFAMIRNEEQVDSIKRLGGIPVLADLEKDFSYVLDKINVVVFTAGSGSKTGPAKTITVDQDGAIKSIQLAKETGIEQYIMISAQGARNPDQPSPIQHYYKAKKNADDFLVQSGVPYTILRPGRLLDEKGTGKIKVGPYFSEKGQTYRDDLAKAVIACIKHPLAVTNKIIEIFKGDTPIEKAIENVFA